MGNEPQTQRTEPSSRHGWKYWVVVSLVLVLVAAAILVFVTLLAFITEYDGH